MGNAVLDNLRQNFRQAVQQHRIADAAQILERMKKVDPVSPETRGSELEFCIESGRLSEAELLAGELCRTFTDSARIFFLAGKLAYRQKRYDTAAAHFRESLRLYPGFQSRYWLGKTLTQAGQFDEAESLLLEARASNPWALLVLGWLHERRGDYVSALKAYDDFLTYKPGDAHATGQRVRVKAKMLDPEALIEEIELMTDFGEPVPDTLLPAFVQGLFETGRTPRARAEIANHQEKLEGQEALQLAWICYRHQAFDLACALFLKQLRANMFNFKFLAALETAARKCNRLPQVIEAYLPLRPEARHLYGRCKRLS